MTYLGPASLRSRFKKAPRPEWKVAESYLKWLRGRPCYLDGHRAGGCGLAEPPRRSPIESAHVDCAGGKGMATRVADSAAIPLCQRHHDEQHGKIGPFKQRGGWPTFQLKYGFNAVDVADAYWKAWPGRAKWEMDRG